MTPGGASVQLPNEALLGEMLREATTYSAVSNERQAVQVEVQNASSIESLDALAASRLNYAGYETTTLPADRHDALTSTLIDFTVTQDPARLSAVAAVLGFSPTALRAAPSEGSPASYRVILGSDYQTCFEPETLSH
jgi:hypothetical protein